MRIAITDQTIKCSKLICAIIPLDRLDHVVKHVSSDLNILPSEVVDLFKRALNPNQPPAYDGTHELAEWYDNNIQLPRLLLSLAQHLAYHDSIPHQISDQLGFDATAVFNEANDFFQNYVSKQRAQLGMS